MIIDQLIPLWWLDIKIFGGFRTLVEWNAQITTMSSPVRLHTFLIPPSFHPGCLSPTFFCWFSGGFSSKIPLQPGQSVVLCCVAVMSLLVGRIVSPFQLTTSLNLSAYLLQSVSSGNCRILYICFPHSLQLLCRNPMSSQKGKLVSTRRSLLCSANSLIGMAIRPRGCHKVCRVHSEATIFKSNSCYVIIRELKCRPRLGWSSNTLPFE